MKVLLIQENEQCLRALLDTNKSQWKEMITILSRGKNDEVEAMADQLKKLFEDGTGPKEKLRTLFVEKFNGLESIKTSLADQRRSNERSIALIDLLITVFNDKPDYQEQFVGIGSIGVITDILKNSGSLEVSGYGFDCLNILGQTNIDWAYTMFQNGLTDNIISALTRNDAVTSPLLTRGDRKSSLDGPFCRSFLNHLGFIFFDETSALISVLPTRGLRKKSFLKKSKSFEFGAYKLMWGFIKTLT